MDSHLEKLQTALSVAIRGMSSEELNWHPPEKWCAAEVLEHLYLTYTGTVKGFERVVAEGKPLATSATLTHRLRSFTVMTFSYLPEGRKAPTKTQPRGLPPETVQSGVAVKIAEMDRIITQCEAQFGAGRKLLDHPILGPLTAGQWRKFHLVHGLHHAKQIQRLRQMRAANVA
jgi:hypothetical protein